MSRARLAVGLVLLVSAVLGIAPAAPAQPAPPGAWRDFEGTWSATGQRQVLTAGGGHVAATIQLSGALVITGGEGLSRGFRGEAIGFDDGANLSVGKSVWTDERGDRIFSDLRGEAIGTGRRILGTITGGTGRYAGLTGEYSLIWQYVVEAERGTIQGRAVDLRGRVRYGEVAR
jgi:hypothetical protein